MTQIEAMKQALEALDCTNGWSWKFPNALSNLREAIQAAEKVEPVGYFIQCGVGIGWNEASQEHWGDPDAIPLYAAPQAKPLSDDRRRDIYNAAMALPDRSTLSVMRYIEKEITK